MTARIYRPTKSATQSGPAGARKHWRLDYTPETPREIEPLMGWTSSTDAHSQVRLSFNTKEEAIAYAERHHLHYRVEEAQATPPRTISYSDNFKSTRAIPWTH